MKYGGITLLRKRIEYLKNVDLPSLDRSREAWKPHEQVFKDKLAELDYMEILLQELLMEREHKKKKKKS